MAHLEEPNRLGKAIADAIDKAEATEIRKSAGEIRKALTAIEKRQTTDEDAILTVVRKIGDRLAVIEKAIGEEALEAATSEPNWLGLVRKYADRASHITNPAERGAALSSGDFRRAAGRR